LENGFARPSFGGAAPFNLADFPSFAFPSFDVALTRGEVGFDFARVEGRLADGSEMAARNIHRSGCSLRDVQLLAGHRSIETTERYIDGDTCAQRRLVAYV
jgi:hypothetical protein